MFGTMSQNKQVSARKHLRGGSIYSNSDVYSNEEPSVELIHQPELKERPSLKDILDRHSNPTPTEKHEKKASMDMNQSLSSPAFGSKTPLKTIEDQPWLSFDPN